MKNYKPLIYFGVLLIGLLLGRYVFAPKTPEKSFSFFAGQISKMQSIINLIDDKYVDNISSEYITEKAIPILFEMLDPHTTYTKAEDKDNVQRSLTQNFKGIGIEFTFSNDTGLITKVENFSPAKKNGLKAGDKIIYIADKAVTGDSINLQTISNLIKGEKSSKVHLKIKRFDRDSLLDFFVERDDIFINNVKACFLADSTTGYIKFDSFGANTYQEFYEKISSLTQKNIKNLIIDLRENGGGYLKTAIDIISLFLQEDQLIAYTINNKNQKTEYRANKENLCKDINIAILVDSHTASASEIFSGAIQDNDRGIIVGRRTFGKGLVQEPYELQDGSMVRITVARYYTPTGRCIQKSYQGNFSDYRNEINKRILEGEMDSLSLDMFRDSIEYKTPKGKIVYGGGGILPDYFVPIKEKDCQCDFCKMVEELKLENKFACYIYNKESTLMDKIDISEKIPSICQDKNFFANFVKYCKNNFEMPSDKNCKNKNQIILNIKSRLYEISFNPDSSQYIKMWHDNDFLKALQQLN